MNITEPRLNAYIHDISLNAQLDDNERVVLREMEAYAKANDFPIIGPLVGRFLRQLAMLTKAERIFEMGSGYGYSAVWFAGGMGNDGRIICTEGSDQNKQRALPYFKRLGIESRIDFRVGNALDIIAEEDGPFDIILNDIDKHQYPQALELAIPRLRPGGVMITDNVLWSGRILDDNPGKSTKGILEFNNLIFSSDGMFSSIIPIRDGLAMIVKA